LETFPTFAAARSYFNLPPFIEIPTLISRDFFCPFPQYWRGSRHFPLERPCVWDSVCCAQNPVFEYICKRKGIAVAYVAEQFENDGSPVSTIVKGVKRAMAGEYSRELSAKVFAGQCQKSVLRYED
jgi:hypothetical protein